MLLLAERSVSHPQAEEKPFIPAGLHTEKPSERLRFAMLALLDAEKEDSLVKPDMKIWHGVRGVQCFACLGGLAAIRRFNLNPMVDSLGESLVTMGVSLYTKAHVDVGNYEGSLDSFRIGVTGFAFGQMGLPMEEGAKFSRTICDYHKSPDGFKKDMENLILDLKESGW